MFKYIAKLVVMFLVLVVANVALSANQSAYISRGQTGVWAMNAGDNLTVYYTPDGSSCTLSWWNNPYWNYQHNPYTTASIYGYSSRYGWQFIWGNSVMPWPWTTNWTLLLGRGAQCKVVFRNLKGGDIVYLKVR